MAPLTKQVTVLEDGAVFSLAVTRKGVGPIQTKFGNFWQYDFLINDQWEKYSVLVKATIDPKSFQPVLRNKTLPLRIDSGCETGQVFHDLTCECGEQLAKTMRFIARSGEGIIVHIPKQDGRGMGLPFKLATLWAQKALQLDTIEAASVLTPDGMIDKRTYLGVVCILKFFGIKKTVKINLATNNPSKNNVFIDNGYALSKNIPVKIRANKYTRVHLLSKKKHLGHKL
ncbi:MAG: hypothetical protein LBU20_00275 [Candidatus Nomurabacteria bacterium]|nr:hypothetical protein [Candidatus Nomurabacteria bacterium]